MKDWKLALVVGAMTLGGVVLGATLFGSDPVQAQQGPYRECFIARQETVDTNNEAMIERPGRNRLITVPPGFEPVGAGGLDGNWVGVVAFCRR